MGNNPISSIDPDGGTCVDADNNPITCPEGYGAFSGPTVDTGVFDNGNFVGYQMDEITITSSRGITPPIAVQNSLNFDTESNAMAYFGLALGQLEKINIGQLKKSGDYRIYYNNASGPKFNGNQYVILHNVGKYAKIGGNVFTAIELGGHLYDVATKEGSERETAAKKLGFGVALTGASYYYPPIGIVFTVGTILTNTEEYKQGVHQNLINKAKKAPIGSSLRSILYSPNQDGREFKQRN